MKEPNISKINLQHSLPYKYIIKNDVIYPPLIKHNILGVNTLLFELITTQKNIKDFKNKEDFIERMTKIYDNSNVINILSNELFENNELKNEIKQQ